MLLDEYRLSFGEAYQTVLNIVEARGYRPTGRLAKSTNSIADKLRRESIRLSQMQEIAGCRIVVTDLMSQDRCVADLRSAFPEASVVDRRAKATHGYRAVHFIAEVDGKSVEIQIRTRLQHEWAEVSEKFSDVLDPEIKYGGGPAKWRTLLLKSSRFVASCEGLEPTLANLHTIVQALEAGRDESYEGWRGTERLLDFAYAKWWERNMDDLRKLIQMFEDDERQRQ